MKAMKVADHDSQVEYDPDHIRIRITGYHGSPDQAIQLIDEVADAGHVNSTDRGVARKMIRDWDDYREPVECRTYVGTRISVDRL